MDLGINLAPPNARTTSPYCNRSLCSAGVGITKAGSLSPRGWPNSPGGYQEGAYLGDTPRDFVFVVLSGAVSSIDVNQTAPLGGHIKVTITNGIGKFTARGYPATIGVTVTANMETRWAIVPADEYAIWQGDKHAFSPSYVARYKGFKCLRMMDWMGTNNNVSGGYPDPDVDAAGPFHNYSSLMLMAKLSIQTRIPLHINIPVAASDDDVRAIMKVFEVVRSAGIPIYVEFSNETWNEGFKAVHAYAIAQEKALIAAKKLPAVATPNGAQFYGYRATQVSKVIQKAGWVSRKQFLMVAGCFTNGFSQSVQVLAGMKAAEMVDTDFADWTISAYIHGDVAADFDKTVAMVKAHDLDAAFESIIHGAKSSPDWAASAILPKHKALADAHGWNLTVYEGNTSFYTIPKFADSALSKKVTGVTKAQVIAFFSDIMNDPRAADVMTASLKACAAGGVSLFNPYNDQGLWGENGLWGLEGTPGWDAIQKWIASNRPSNTLSVRG